VIYAFNSARRSAGRSLEQKIGAMGALTLFAARGPDQRAVAGGTLGVPQCGCEVALAESGDG